VRRIIERVVTVVTTTTWKISWEPDEHPLNPVSDLLSSPDVRSETRYGGQTSSDAIETKEVDPSQREEKTTDQAAEEPLRKSY
jgi:hypothetical protein